MADDVAVTIRVPGLLTRFTDGQSTVTVRADTVADSVEALLRDYPALEPHLHDADGALRSHLALIHEGSTVPEDEADEVALEAADEVVVLQAVSGG